MQIITVFLIIVLALIIGAVGASLMSKAAVSKGYGSNEHIWAICFFLGFFGYLYVVALPDKVVQSQNQRIIELLRKEEM